MSDMETSGPQVETLPGSVYRVLLQFALLGTEIGKVSLAMEIAETLSELCPNLPHASIVLGISEFAMGRQDAGIRSLEQTLEKFPNSQLGKAMLAVCLQNTGRAGWQALLESVIDDGRDEHAIGLASALLGRKHQTDANNPLPFSVPSTALWA